MFKRINKIADLEQKAFNSAFTVERFENVLKYTKQLFRLEQDKVEKQIEQNSRFQMELLFWLPGYLEYKNDYLIRDKLKNIMPDRINNFEEKELSHNDFIYFGDVQRMMQVIDIKLNSQTKLEKANGKIRTLTIEYEMLKNRYDNLSKEYKKIIKDKHMKNKIINDLTTKLESLEAIEKERQEKLKMTEENSKEAQTESLETILGLLEDAKEQERSKNRRKGQSL